MKKFNIKLVSNWLVSAALRGLAVFGIFGFSLYTYAAISYPTAPNDITVVYMETAGCADGQLPLADASSSTGWICSDGAESLWETDGTDVWRASGKAGVGRIPVTILDIYNKGTDTLGSIRIAEFTTTTPGRYSFINGYSAKAEGNYGFAHGPLANASGTQSFAIGGTASGESSVATWAGTASGKFSIAMGETSQATAYHATAIGNNTLADHENANAFGIRAYSQADNATAIGHFTTATSMAMATVGSNNVTDPGWSTNAWVSTDPIFVVGNGPSNAPSTAMTVLKNGNVGIGTIQPSAELSVMGQVGIGLETAGYVSSVGSSDPVATLSIWNDGDVSPFFGATVGALLSSSNAGTEDVLGFYNLVTDNGDGGAQGESIYVVDNDAGSAVGLNIYTTDPDAGDSTGLIVYANSPGGTGNSLGIDALAFQQGAGDAYGIFAKAADGIGANSVYQDPLPGGGGDVYAILARAKATLGGSAYSFYGENGVLYNADRVGVGTDSPSAKVDIRGVPADPQNFIQLEPDGNARFYNSGDIQLMMNGDVGIGDSTPNAKLDVEGEVRLHSIYGENPSNLTITSEAGYYVDIRPNDPDYGLIIRRNGDTSDYANIEVGDTYMNIGKNTSGGDLQIYDDGKVRVVNGPDNNGTTASLVVGDGVQNLYVDGNEIDSDYASGLYLNNNYKSYTVRVPSITYYSDRRFKENIADIDYGLAEVVKMRPVSFNFKGGDPSAIEIGFIAQEMENVIPDLVDYDADPNQEGMMSIKYSGITPVLVNAIKELKAQNDALLELVCELKPEADLCN